jgi:hypothetical protein
MNLFGTHVKMVVINILMMTINIVVLSQNIHGHINVTSFFGGVNGEIGWAIKAMKRGAPRRGPRPAVAEGHLAGLQSHAPWVAQALAAPT